MDKSPFERDVEIHHALQAASSFLGHLSNMSIHQNNQDCSVWFSCEDGHSVYWSDIREGAAVLLDQVTDAIYVHAEQMTRHEEMNPSKPTHGGGGVGG